MSSAYPPQSGRSEPPTQQMYAAAGPAPHYPQATDPARVSRPVVAGRTAPIRGALLSLAGIGTAASAFQAWLDYQGVRITLFGSIDQGSLTETLGSDRLASQLDRAVRAVEIGVHVAGAFVVFLGLAMLIGGICAVAGRGMGRGVGIGAGLVSGIIAAAAGGATLVLPPQEYGNPTGPMLCAVCGVASIVIALALAVRRSIRPSSIQPGPNQTGSTQPGSQ